MSETKGYEMKEKGFDKPVKYIFIGQPNTTKTTLAHKANLKVFETDGLLEEELFDISKYDLSVDVIIIGGKWIKHQLQIMTMLSTELKDYQLIQVRFTAPATNTLKFFIRKADADEYNEGGGYMVFIATDDQVMQIHLNNDDGYRSHADPMPDEEIDGFKFWLNMEGGREKVFEIPYEEIVYGVKESGRYAEARDVLIRAKLHGKIIFEVGTDNSDDYYPSYYLTCEGKDLEEILKEVGLD